MMIVITSKAMGTVVSAIVIMLLVFASRTSALRCDKCQYWDQKFNICKDCPPKTFQPYNLVLVTMCTPHTFKDSSDHWIMTELGSKCTDNKWECEEGYKEDNSVCEKIMPSTPVPEMQTPSVQTSSTFKPYNSSVDQPKSTTPFVVNSTNGSAPNDSTSEHDDDDNIGLRIVIPVSILVLLFIIIVVIIIICKYLPCCKKTQNPPLKAIYEQVETSSFESGMDYAFCYNFMLRLVENAKIFLVVLLSCDTDFEADALIFVEERNNQNDFVKSCANVLWTWATKNKPENHKALIIEALQFLKENMNTDILSRLCGEEAIYISDTMRRQMPQAGYRFFYYLTAQLSTGDIEHMVTSLHQQRNAASLIDRNRKTYPHERSFADTKLFIEWYKQENKPGFDVKGLIFDALRNRLDVPKTELLDDDQFIELLSYISPREDSVEEINEQGERHCADRFNHTATVESGPLIEIPLLPDVPTEDPELTNGGDNLDGSSPQTVVNGHASASVTSGRRSPVACRIEAEQFSTNKQKQASSNAHGGLSESEQKSSKTKVKQPDEQTLVKQRLSSNSSVDPDETHVKRVHSGRGDSAVIMAYSNGTKVRHSHRQAVEPNASNRLSVEPLLQHQNEAIEYMDAC